MNNHSTDTLVIDKDEMNDCATPFAPRAGAIHPDKADHFVQFYEEDAFLIESVAGFIGAGLLAGESAIVIATGTHRDDLEERLAEMGVNSAEVRASGQFFLLDANETLAKFMVNGSPDEGLFLKAVGSVVNRASQNRRGLRAFGEMVAVLWAEGNAAAAIRLEELWNDLVKACSFSLFCAYPIRGFQDEAMAKSFIHICKEHSHVLPAESYATKGTSDMRLRSIALLQQKANSLETEITRRREIERVLARREQELSDFLENATEAIHQVGPDGTILWANQAELELLGYAANEYIGRPIADFHADPEVIADIFERLTRGEKLKNYEARLKCKDGSIRHVAINSSVYWKDDQFSHTKCFTRDITERKRAAEILEKTVAERTAQLNETIGELEAFSYSISHDMRSPLRAMQAYAGSLREDYAEKLDDDAINALERIERASARLDLLIRDVLAYSKVAKGQIELKAIPLGPLIEELLQQHPEFDKLRACITVDKPLHTVMGHEAYLTQCITNLVNNALKFVAPSTIPRVHIRSEALPGKVRVRISDHGIGIAPEHYDRLFKIFGRVYSEKHYEGTRIGLAIVKKAVARMGGEAGFESEPGKGASFWFMLPSAPHDQ